MSLRQTWKLMALSSTVDTAQATEGINIRIHAVLTATTEYSIYSHNQALRRYLSVSFVSGQTKWPYLWSYVLLP